MQVSCGKVFFWYHSAFCSKISVCCLDLPENLQSLLWKALVIEGPNIPCVVKPDPLVSLHNRVNFPSLSTYQHCSRTHPWDIHYSASVFERVNQQIGTIGVRNFLFFLLSAASGSLRAHIYMFVGTDPVMTQMELWILLAWHCLDNPLTSISHGDVYVGDFVCLLDTQDWADHHPNPSRKTVCIKRACVWAYFSVRGISWREIMLNVHNLNN